MVRKLKTARMSSASGWHARGREVEVPSPQIRREHEEPAQPRREEPEKRVDPKEVADGKTEGKEGSTEK